MSHPILCIESSAQICGAYLTSQDKVYQQVIEEGFVHSELLASYVHQVVEMAAKDGVKPVAIAVNAGPGSYTGLRIVAALAKGLCMGFDIPLIALNALDVLIEQGQARYPNASAIFAAINANNNRVYLSGASKTSGDIFKAKLVDLQIEKDQIPDLTGAVIMGDGAEIVKAAIQATADYHFSTLQCEWLNDVAQHVYDSGEFTSLHAFKPNYLKKFVTTTPKTLDRILKGQ